MPPTVSVLSEPSATTVDEETISYKVDDSEMVILGSDDQSIPVTESKLTESPPGTSNTNNISIHTPASETGDFLADTLWNRFEKHLEAKRSRDSVERNEAFEEISKLKKTNQELLARIRADKEKITFLKEQRDNLMGERNKFKDIASDLRGQLDDFKSRMTSDQSMTNSRLEMPIRGPTQVPRSPPMLRIPIDGQYAPISEIRELRPPGYSFYQYFDSKQFEVNGERLEPVWRHGVVLPNVFFTRDHIDEILFPNGRTLRRSKDPFWFKLVRDFIHTSEGVALFADMLWLDWTHKSGRPTKEAIQLRTELYEIKGGAGNIVLSVEDLRREHENNPNYTDAHTARLYIIISRWILPHTPQSRERRLLQRESRPKQPQGPLIENRFPRGPPLMMPRSQSHRAPSRGTTSVEEDSVMEDAKTTFHEVDNTSYYSSEAGDDIDIILNGPPPISTTLSHTRQRSPKRIKA